MHQVRISEDPDGLDCYSDHDNDVLHYGQCMMCASSSNLVVGHVLPEVERVKGWDPVAAAELVLGDQTMRMFDGVLLDLVTANTIFAVHEALSEPMRAKLRTMPLVKAGEVCFKLTNRH